MTKEDLVDEIFINGINISLFALPYKSLLANIGENEEMRQAAIRELKGMCSNITCLLNGLRSEEDFERYSKGYFKSKEMWISAMKEQGIDNCDEKLSEYRKMFQDFINLLEKGK